MKLLNENQLEQVSGGTQPNAVEMLIGAGISLGLGLAVLGLVFAPEESGPGFKKGFWNGAANGVPNVWTRIGYAIGTGCSVALYPLHWVGLVDLNNV